MRFPCGVLFGMIFSPRYSPITFISCQGQCSKFLFPHICIALLQVFRALRTILNGVVAFFVACNRHRLRCGIAFASTLELACVFLPFFNRLLCIKSF